MRFDVPGLNIPEAVFLLDSAAQINVIKKDVLDLNTFINSYNRVTVSGITAGTATTLGTVKLKLFEVEHEFHVLDSNSLVNHDAILGNPFFMIAKARIDYLNLSNLFRSSTENIQAMMTTKA